ncbi:MAG: four helix bundle protein [Balneolaceae bacterium]
MYELENLETWKKARELRIAISKFAKTLPDEERYKLKNQILRSSRSVAANIAEGYGRFYFQETIHFCRQARGSLYETQEHLICALDEGYIQKEEYDQLIILLKDCLKILNGYISYLKKEKTKN